MSERWKAAVEDAADALGELLLEVAGGGVEYTHDDIAPIVLRAGLATLLVDGPTSSRIDAASRVIYDKLHDSEAKEWSSLSAIEKSFWRDIARAAIAAADAALLHEIGPGDVH
ncbi:MAG: hypothetical protein KIT00_05230 [Rhodospirillales bacterium]|nr:hypothetical protein [Rhodospirillales bacterium]